MIDEFPSVVTTKDREVALKDFNGYSNSNTITGNDWDGIYEAIFAAWVEWPNDHTNGYVGSLGEWQELYQHIDEVNEYLVLIDGDPIDSYYWSSTLYDTEAAWIFLAYPSTPDLSGEDFSHTNDTATVRSFYPIDLSNVTVVQ